MLKNNKIYVVKKYSIINTNNKYEVTIRNARYVLINLLNQMLRKNLLNIKKKLVKNSYINDWKDNCELFNINYIKIY